MTARDPSSARSAVAGLACRPGCTSLTLGSAAATRHRRFSRPIQPPRQALRAPRRRGREIRLQPYGSRRAAATRTVLGGLY